MDDYNILLNKYDQHDAQYIFDMYYYLLCKIQGCISNISDSTKDSILNIYYEISKSFFLTIMSKSNNYEYPDIVEMHKKIYEDISFKFLDYFKEEGITMDEVKMISLKAKICITDYLKEIDNLCEYN